MTGRWLKKSPRRSLNILRINLIHQIWVPETSGFFQYWSTKRKIALFRRLKPWKRSAKISHSKMSRISVPLECIILNESLWAGKLLY
jgi:hypothetical protein